MFSGEGKGGKLSSTTIGVAPSNLIGVTKKGGWGDGEGEGEGDGMRGVLLMIPFKFILPLLSKSCSSIEDISKTEESPRIKRASSNTMSPRTPPLSTFFWFAAPVNDDVTHSQNW